MKMDRKYIRRRRAVFGVAIVFISFFFGYATADTCYVGIGQPNTFMGYGSCIDMIDRVVSNK